MRCINCMRTLNESGGVCPHCGFDAVKYKPPNDALPPGSVLNDEKYVIGRVLGRGGFGVTYVALDQNLGLRVAVKECLPQRDAWRNDSGASVQWSVPVHEQETAMENFVREARKMAQIYGISGVVPVREYFYDNETAYIVMDYVDGETLSQRLRRTGPLSARECFRLLSPVMESLAQAHGRGLVHRDIKPNNIMIERTRDGEKIWLLDLGAAKDLGTRFDAPNVSAESRIIGTPGYTPLEQCSPDGRIGPWTDVYAMSATFFYCMTGNKPPDSRSRFLETQTPQVLLSVPGAVGDVLRKGMALRPVERYQTMWELRDALEKAVNDTDETRYYEDKTELLAEPVEVPPQLEPELEEIPPETPEPQPEPVEIPQETPEPVEVLPEPPEPEPRPVDIPQETPKPVEVLPETPEPEPKPAEVLPEPPEPEAQPVDIPLETPEPVEVLPETPEPEPPEPELERVSQETPKSLLEAVRLRPETPEPEAETTKEKPSFATRFFRIVGTLFVASLIIFSLLIAFGAFLVSQQEKLPKSGECGDNITWSLDEDGLLTISGTGDMWDYSKSPWKDYLSSTVSSVNLSSGITRIGNHAFASLYGLSSVVISEGVTEIGEGAFKFSNTTEVTIPDSVTTIGKEAFYGCDGLKSVTIPYGVTTIGKEAFCLCDNLKSVVIPDSVTTIGEGAFKSCKKLESVTIPDSVTTIGQHAFYLCSNLSSASVPAKLNTSSVFGSNTTVTRREDSAADGELDALNEEIEEEMQQSNITF